MAHYAKLDDDNIVIDVIVIANKDCLDETGNECEEPGRRMCEALTGHKKWKKTSYNTKFGIHYDSNTGEPSEDQSKAYRLNFAQAGMRYDEELDGFVVTEQLVPKRVPRMSINPKTGVWCLKKPTISIPQDLEPDKYPPEEYIPKWFWNEFLYEWKRYTKDYENPAVDPNRPVLNILPDHVFTDEEMI
jgi:hypothetical protein